jgi:hypothetical protein
MRRFAIASAAVAVLLLASAAVAAASGWSIEHTPNHRGSSETVLNGVSCASTSRCTAVGNYYIGMSPGMVAQRWNGSKWSTQRTPTPTGASGTALDGVSCVSASACTAVGYYYKATGQVTLAERWNGTKWSIQRTPNPKGASNIELDGVSCVSASACTAVGYYINSTDTALITLAERWNGTKWSIEPTPNPKGVPDSYLFGVSCASARVCTATGYYYNGSVYRTLAERWNGTKWSIEHTPNPTGSLQSVLESVSCVSASACTAVGLWVTSTVRSTLAERWNGTKWSIETTPNPTGAPSSELHGVSCTASGACTATGQYYNGSANVTMAQRWNGTKWSIETTPNPTGASSSELDGVSCVSARACTAVGQYSNGTKTLTLAERRMGGA